MNRVRLPRTLHREVSIILRPGHFVPAPNASPGSTGDIIGEPMRLPPFFNFKVPTNQSNLPSRPLKPNPTQSSGFQSNQKATGSANTTSDTGHVCAVIYSVLSYCTNATPLNIANPQVKQLKRHPRPSAEDLTRNKGQLRERRNSQKHSPKLSLSIYNAASMEASCHLSTKGRILLRNSSYDHSKTGTWRLLRCRCSSKLSNLGARS